MMALLQETVLGFEEQWIECYGDLALYGTAIETMPFGIKKDG
jgi:hypothetical protein